MVTITISDRTDSAIKHKHSRCKVLQAPSMGVAKEWLTDAGFCYFEPDGWMRSLFDRSESVSLVAELADNNPVWAACETLLEEIVTERKANKSR